MSHPYKTRSGGATVTIFVPYDCRNHCPFCINKKEYADCTGFSVEAILRSIAVMDAISRPSRIIGTWCADTAFVSAFTGRDCCTT